jgi:hypothetical protein
MAAAEKDPPKDSLERDVSELLIKNLSRPGHPRPPKASAGAYSLQTVS